MYGAPPPAYGMAPVAPMAPAYGVAPVAPMAPVAPVAPVAPAYYGAPAPPQGPTVITIGGQDQSSGVVCPVCGKST